MNCLYCQQTLSDKPKFNPAREDLLTWRTAECQDCKAVFYFQIEKPPHTIIWEGINIGNKEYRIRLYPKFDKLVTSHFEIAYVIAPRVYQTVHLFSFIPESWTPYNVAQKLRSYLLFL